MLKLNEETMEVQITLPWGDEKVISYLEYYASKYVTSHLHWNGANKNNITIHQWSTAYLMCDGFGEITFNEASRQCYDWSHVRDSSNETLIRVAEWIAVQNGDTLQNSMDKFLGAIKEIRNHGGEISPLDC